MSVLTPFVLILFSSITGVMTILTLQQFWRPGKFTASTLCWMWRAPLSFIMVFASQSSLPLTPIPDKVQLIDWWSHLFRPAIWESGPRPIHCLYLLLLCCFHLRTLRNRDVECFMWGRALGINKKDNLGVRERVELGFLLEATFLFLFFSDWHASSLFWIMEIIIHSRDHTLNPPND